MNQMKFVFNVLPQHKNRVDRVTKDITESIGVKFKIDPVSVGSRVAMYCYSCENLTAQQSFEIGWILGSQKCDLGMPIDTWE